LAARKNYNLHAVATAKLSTPEEMTTISFDFAEDILLPKY